MSEDGTMVAVPHSDSPQSTADSSAVAGASDTESNSERDHEVHKASHQWTLFRVFFKFLQLKRLPCFILLSGLPRRARSSEESVVKCVIISSLER